MNKGWGWHRVRSKSTLGKLLMGRTAHVVPIGFDSAVTTSHACASAMLEEAGALDVYVKQGYAQIHRANITDIGGDIRRRLADTDKRHRDELE